MQTLECPSAEPQTVIRRCACCREISPVASAPVWRFRFWLCGFCAQLPQRVRENLLVPVLRRIRQGD